ncbi:hypothetical protein [Sulfuricaulis sp.]|jgi:hypothetical protein|uniref:hypothetical protein n=1 Tax=Sulfuricaulis sp. TaxID=2003553 RepID=UPI0035598C51
MTDEQLVKLIDKVIKKFHGNGNELETAIGSLILWRHLGRKVLLLVHDKTTLKKYEKLLGVDVRTICPAKGPLARRSLASTAVTKPRTFWKAVKGEIPNVKTFEIQSLEPILQVAYGAVD